MRILNKDIAHLLRSVAAVYLLKGANRFRIIAYQNAADSVEHMNRELYDLWENDKLQNIEGIGPSISQHLDEYFRNGDNSYLIKTISKIPAAVLELMKVPGIGPKKAYKLTTNLNLKNKETAIDDLLQKAKTGQIASIETFGEKSQNEIINTIQLYKESVESRVRMPLPYAYRLAEEVINYLKENPKVLHVDMLGSLRRKVSTIGDIDLAVVCESKHSNDIIDHFIKFPGQVKIDGKGEKKASITLANGRRIDLRTSPHDSYGAMLQYFTGSKSHNIKLREYARELGYSLSEYGIKEIKTGTIHKYDTEEKFYRRLKLGYIEPEIREGTNEIDLAKKSTLPKLVEQKEIKGEFHIHSSYDLKPSHDLGVNTYQELLKTAESMNYEYVAFSDHNPKISDLSESQITAIMKKRYEFIHGTLYNKSKRCKYFISCEVDITPTGKIALPEEALGYVDMIIVSIHSSFRMARADMTRRILKALRYPKVKIFAHPTARLLGKRPEIDVDWPEIFKVCKSHNIALEINAWPERLDLPDVLAREAKSYGVLFAIDTDAHAASQMGGIFYGVSVARRGWLEKKDVINTRPYEEVEKWIRD